MKKISKYVKYIAFAFILCVTTTGNVFAGCTGANKACIECSYNINMNDGTMNNVTFTVVDQGNGVVDIPDKRYPEKFILDYQTNNLTGSYFIHKPSKKMYCPTLYYKLVAENSGTSTNPQNPYNPDKQKYKLILGGNPNVGDALIGKKTDGNDIALSEDTKNTKYCSFTGVLTDNYVKKKDITVNFNITGNNLDGIYDESGQYYLKFENIKASDIDSACNYNGKKIYILCNSGKGNDDPASSNKPGMTSGCTISTNKFYGSEEGTITNPEDAGQESNNQENNNSTGTGITFGDGDADCKYILSQLLDEAQKIFDWLKIIAPILVIAFGSLDFVKATVAMDDKGMKTAMNKFPKRLIAAAVLFFLPYLINLVLSLPGLEIEDAVCGISKVVFKLW